MLVGFYRFTYIKNICFYIKVVFLINLYKKYNFNIKIIYYFIINHIISNIQRKQPKQPGSGQLEAKSGKVLR